MRKILCLLGLLYTILPAVPAQAACNGQDLIAALPGPERQKLQDRADSVPFARGNLWTARRGDQVIHLAGTYHLPDARHADTLAALAPALQAAQVLLVEASPREEAALKAEIARRPEFMVITEGPRLSEQLPPPEWEKLAQEAQLRGIPSAMADRLRPWYMAVLLGIPACATGALQAGGRGLDHQLMDLAAGRDLPVRALEPFDTLFSIFGELTPADETEMVRASLLTAERPEDMTVTLANAYFAGQSRLVWEFTRDLAASVPGSTESDLNRQFDLMQDVLMVRRNQRWLSVLTDAAKDGPVLAAFGALHLSGAQGVLQLLQDAGFTLTPMGG